MEEDFSSNVSELCDILNASCDNQDEASAVSTFDPLIPKIVLLSVVSLILVTTNGLLIFTILYHKHLHSKANYFLVALACSDFCLGFPAIPIHCMAEATVFGKGEMTCLMTMCLTTAQMVLSVLMLFALSVERYIKLVHPFSYAKYINRKKVFLCIAFCSIYCLLIASLPLMGWNNLDPSQVNNDMDICRYEIIMSPSYTMLIFGCHIGPAFIILPVLYFHIFCTAHHVLRRRSQNSASQTACKTCHQSNKSCCTPKEDSSSMAAEEEVTKPQQPPKSQTKPKKVFVPFKAFSKPNPNVESACNSRSYRHFKVLTLAGAYFMISWLPLVIWEIALCRGGAKDIVRAQDYLNPPISVMYYFAALGLAMANSAINPLLFGIGNQTIRSAFLNAVVRCKRKSSIQEEHSTLMPMKEYDIHKRPFKNETAQRAHNKT